MLLLVALLLLLLALQALLQLVLVAALLLPLLLLLLLLAAHVAAQSPLPARQAVAHLLPCPTWIAAAMGLPVGAVAMMMAAAAPPAWPLPAALRGQVPLLQVSLLAAPMLASVKVLLAAPALLGWWAGLVLQVPLLLLLLLLQWRPPWLQLLLLVAERLS